MTSTDRLGDLSAIGTSIWLDDLSRNRLQTGNLQQLIDTKHVVGVTTNPAIFAAAINGAPEYDEQVTALATQGVDVEDALTTITTDDVRAACDLFAGVYEASDGFDGRVSIEVDPRLSHETDATIEQARTLWRIVDRPNVMIKIPATVEGLPAITQAISEGISVNVTLIFSLDRYRAVAGAYLDGLEKAARNGVDLATIHSVASFFVSRVDSEIDARLEDVGTPEALELRGKSGVANARLAYQAFEEIFSSPRFEELAAAGANVQRPLWASTGVKNPDYSPTMYVDDLAVDRTVNTMPEGTLVATEEKAQLRGDAVRGTYEEARQVLDEVERVGVSYEDVVEKLEVEGLKKFEDAWEDLIAATRTALEQHAQA